MPCPLRDPYGPDLRDMPYTPLGVGTLRDLWPYLGSPNGVISQPLQGDITGDVEFGGPFETVAFLCFWSPRNGQHGPQTARPVQHRGSPPGGWRP